MTPLEDAIAPVRAWELDHSEGNAVMQSQPLDRYDWQNFTDRSIRASDGPLQLPRHVETAEQALEQWRLGSGPTQTRTTLIAK